MNGTFHSTARAQIRQEFTESFDCLFAMLVNVCLISCFAPVTWAALHDPFS